MKLTIIQCTCQKEQGKGDLLGVIKTEEGEWYLHKCLKCRRQVKEKVSDGLHYA